MQKEYAVHLRNVNKYFGSNIVLRNLCMRVEVGTIYGLLGASGCGKTTLLKVLVRTMKIDSGEINVLGEKVNGDNNEFPVHKLGYMPQDTALCGEFTVKDAVFYFGTLFGINKTILLDRYNDLHKLLELPPHNSNKADLHTKLAEAGDKLVVIDFYASWCGPCKMISPKVEELSIEYEDVIMLKVDVDEFEDIALEYNISSMPTFVFIKNSTIINSFSGANYDKLKAVIEANYAHHPSKGYIKNCSGGEQRRVSLAATLVHKPALLILDEPTVGLDPLIRKRIWQHLLNITRTENTTIIITTHYVDECRDVDRIGLLRGGKLLSEESPHYLMNRVHAETIEEAFLSLAKLDNQYTKSALPALDETRKKKRNFKTRGTRKLKKRWSVDRHRFGALLDKNWKQFYRNITGIFFLLSLPLLEIGAFLSSVGSDVRNIPIGIVNNEILDCTNFTTNGTTDPYDYFQCHFYNISCRFLTHLEDPMINKVFYPDLDAAFFGVKQGHISGILYMSQNFSQNFEKRIEEREVDTETVDQSQIKVWLDMSNYQIALSLKQKLVEKYNEFQESIFEDCDFILKVFEQPLRMDTFYVGSNKNEPFIVFMMPGILITIQFFLGAVMTSQTIITDRHDGVWDRSVVAGVTSMEITLSHLFLQAFILMFQTLEMMFCVFVLYRMEYIGSIVLSFLLVFSQGICGMAYGFFVSVISKDHTMANVVLMGLYLPVNILSGWMWPIEGMVYGLQILARCFPFAAAIDSLRNILKKGWSIKHLKVFDGFLIGGLWTLLFGVISIYIISRKR